MNLIRRIIKIMTKKNPVTKTVLKSKNIVNNVYGTEELGLQSKRFHKIHYVLKYKILIPVLLIVNRWIDKRIGSVDLDKPQLEYLKVFNEAWDEATAKWLHYYIWQKDTPEGIEEAREIAKKNKGTHQWLNMLKKISSTIIAYDDAYMEFLTLFQWEYYGAIKNHWDDKEVTHVMRYYHGKMDPDYEVAYMQLRSLKQFELRRIGQIPDSK